MKKILFNTEASYMATGYGRYSHEVLKRLHESGKYLVAELASYGISKEEASLQNDSRPYSIPWKYYPVLPNSNDEKGKAEYNSDPFNQFGKWRWEHTCLDFLPDVTFAIRDNWYDNYMVSSPFRNCYNLAWMPTCDSLGFKPEWISDCVQLDACFTYTNWAQDLLKDLAGTKIKLRGTASPCADPNIFTQIHNKRELKASIGINPQSIIIGTTMRNQKRKLFPNLFRAFAEFLKGPKEITEDVFLYCHTHWPDLGWDIPNLIKDFGISRRVLFTYTCLNENCKAVFQNLFSDARMACVKCGQYSATLPNSNHGVNTKDLVAIYNLFDIYVQYSSCLTPGQKIKTITEWKNIEDIKEGELVYTHKGNYRKVLKTFVNEVDKNVRKFKIYGDIHTLEVTNEHPIYGVFKKTFGDCYRTLKESIGSQKKPFKLDFLKAEDIQKGDLLAYRIDDYVLDTFRIDLGDYTKENDFVIDEKINTGSGKVYNRYINIDNDFCKFIGLFVADGNESNGSIKVTCGLVEDNNINLSELILNKINGKSTKRFYKDRKALDIYSYSKVFAGYLRKNCYNNKSKKLPDFVLELPIEKQKNVLQGLFMGDGHYIKHKNISAYFTTSYELSEQIKILLHRLRINYNIRLVKRDSRRKDAYIFEVYGDFKNGDILKVKHNSKSLYYENYILKQVKYIEDSNYVGKVYNIEVEEDNSYTTKVSQVHNCEGFGCPIIEAACCGVPTMVVDYSGMEDFKDTINAVPIKYSSLEMESETGTYKAIPDDKDFIEKLTYLITLPDMVRRKMGYENKLLCHKNYNWDNTTKAWMDYFDSAEPGKWDRKPNIIKPNLKIPNNLSNDNFLKWCLSNILCKPEYINTYMYFKLLKNLNLEYTISNYGGFHISDSLFGERPNFKPFNRNDLVNEFLRMVEFNNKWESKRVSVLNTKI